MSFDWKVCQLGNVLTLQRGFDILKKQLKPGIYDVILSSGVGGNHNEFKVKAPGVVIGRMRCSAQVLDLATGDSSTTH